MDEGCCQCTDGLSLPLKILATSLPGGHVLKAEVSSRLARDLCVDRLVGYRVHSAVSNKCIAVRKVATPLRELTCHGITQCYLPPGRGDIPTLTPAEAGTRLSDPGGMQG